MYPKVLSLAFLFTLILSSTSCAQEQSDEVVSNPLEDTEIEASITYLALGDSYTIGQGVEVSQRWPNQLATTLNTQGVSFNKVDIIARTGWTARNLMDAIQEENPTQYDLVSLLIGVNNQYQQKSFELFKTELDSLINTSILLAGNKDNVFMVSIPDYGVTPFGASWSDQIAKELDQYNLHIQEQCELYGITFINITDISRELGNKENALASDQLHPSGFQYGLWVDRIAPVVLQLIRE